LIVILGISAFYHDSAAALIIDGRIVAAAQEERFTRIKHDPSFPIEAIKYCLKAGEVSIADITAIVFYDKPIIKFERLIETYLAFAPLGFKSFLKAIPIWLSQKLFLPKLIKEGLGEPSKAPIFFPEHHESHAASAFFPSPFEKAAVITFDGVGEWATTSWGVGEGHHLDLKAEIHFPHSLGLLYSAFTYYTGFKVNSGEYKVMGLAPYGNPVKANEYADLVFEHILDLKEDGSFWMDQSYFNYCVGLTMTSKKFHDLFGGEPRESESTISQREMDLALAVQIVTEKVIFKIADHVQRETGLNNLCLAGGVALNCVANGKLLKNGPFENIWIQPAAGDAGAALGAALFTWHHILEKERTVEDTDSQRGSYLGPEYSNEEIIGHLDRVNAVYQTIDIEEDLCKRVAELLSEGKVIGLFQGPMEFGPRALGGRSIIGDPRSVEMQSNMNLRIKFRESFRPFAPSCLEERVLDYFELDKTSPYMLLVAQVQESLREPVTEEQEELFGIDKLKVVRSKIPSITHVDYSARVQTVNKHVSPRYYNIIKAFEEKTGYGLVVNTSFNIRGEPIVGSPEDAYRCFMFTDMDVLLLENQLCLKSEQPEMEGMEEYKKEFKLD